MYDFSELLTCSDLGGGAGPCQRQEWMNKIYASSFADCILIFFWNKKEMPMLILCKVSKKSSVAFVELFLINCFAANNS